MKTLETSTEAIMLVLLTLTCLLRTDEASPVLHQRRHRHRLPDSDSQLDSDQESPTLPLVIPSLQMVPKQYESIYVRFATQPPDTPPWMTADDLVSSIIRHRRSINSTASSNRHVRRSVCESVSRWVAKTQAEDMWGNSIQVVQHINVGNTRVNQYFFETFCASEGCACRGIDTSEYTSSCGSKHIWAYAKTIDSAGQEGWNLIKLRGSCTCSISPKRDEFQSIWNDL